MSGIKIKKNAYKISNEKKSFNPKTISLFNIQSKLIKKSESLSAKTESEFKDKIKKLFEQEKFIINNQYDQDHVQNFLKEKYECLQKIKMADDSILYNNLNHHKKNKNKNKKNRYKSHKNLEPVNIKKEIKIKITNQKAIDSFISNKSEESIEEILKFLKQLEKE